MVLCMSLQSLSLRFYMWDGCCSGVAWVYSYLLVAVGWVCTCACVRVWVERCVVKMTQYFSMFWQESLLELLLTLPKLTDDEQLFLLAGKILLYYAENEQVGKKLKSARKGGWGRSKVSEERRDGKLPSNKIGGKSGSKRLGYEVSSKSTARLPFHVVVIFYICKPSFNNELLAARFIVWVSSYVYKVGPPFAITLIQSTMVSSVKSLQLKPF